MIKAASFAYRMEESLMSVCVFCHKEKIITDFVYEDELVMAFMDLWQ